jgi:hypothetical protein
MPVLRGHGNRLAMTDTPIAVTVPRGWECPRCGRIYAPTVAQCSWCLMDTDIPLLAPKSTFAVTATFGSVKRLEMIDAGDDSTAR